MESLFGTEFAMVIYQPSSANRLAGKVFGNQELNSVASLDEMPTKDAHQRCPPERPELSTAGRVWILVVTGSFPEKRTCLAPRMHMQTLALRRLALATEP